MARTRKTIAEKISALEAQKAQLQAKIEGLKSKISELDDSVKGLQEGKKQQELENLLDTIKASGKTPEEILAALKTE
jgi:hypothetical protein